MKVKGSRNESPHNSSPPLSFSLSCSLTLASRFAECGLYKVRTVLFCRRKREKEAKLVIAGGVEGQEGQKQEGGVREWRENSRSRFH